MRLGKEELLRIETRRPAGHGRGDTLEHGRCPGRFIRKIFRFLMLGLFDCAKGLPPGRVYVIPGRLDDIQAADPQGRDVVKKRGALGGVGFFQPHFQHLLTGAYGANLQDGEARPVLRVFRQINGKLDFHRAAQFPAAEKRAAGIELVVAGRYRISRWMQRSVSDGPGA